MILGRRSFLVGMGAMLAAPAIVHAGNLMPVKAFKIIRLPTEFELELIEAAKQLGAREYDVDSLRSDAVEWAESASARHRAVPTHIVRYPDYDVIKGLREAEHAALH